MNFEYDFKDGHTRFSYRSKPGEVLDEKTWSILTVSVAGKCESGWQWFYFYI